MLDDEYGSSRGTFKSVSGIYITRSPYSKGKTRNVFNISFKKKKFLRVLQ
jgi:hypothetical protein